MNKVLVDTDVLIDFTKGHDRALAALLARQYDGQMELYITPINITEFLNDTALVKSGKLAEAKEFLRLFSVCDTTSAIGITAGEYLRNGTVAFLGDAIIAATSVSLELPLLTRNTKHFAKVPKMVFFDKIA